eukprot:4415246-Alexandrium_andersonii.AAC.1
MGGSAVYRKVATGDGENKAAPKKKAAKKKVGNSDPPLVPEETLKLKVALDDGSEERDVTWLDD